MEEFYYIPDAALYVFVGGFIIGAVALFAFGLWRGFNGR
jgi:hypothetical protein